MKPVLEAGATYQIRGILYSRTFQLIWNLGLWDKLGNIKEPLSLIRLIEITDVTMDDIE